MTGKDWGVLERNKSHQLFIEWRKELAPLEILDMLIAAGLEDVPQEQITKRQFEKAMRKAARK